MTHDRCALLREDVLLLVPIKKQRDSATDKFGERGETVKKVGCTCGWWYRGEVDSKYININPQVKMTRWMQVPDEKAEVVEESETRSR